MMKITKIAGVRLARIFSCAAVAATVVSGYAVSTMAPALSLEQMTNEADEIVIGSVLTDQAKVVGGHIETQYQVQVHENLKSRTAGLPAGKTFTMSLMGGALEEPPLTQYAMGMPYLYQGEEVVLFLKAPAAATKSMTPRSAGAPKSNLSSSYRVIGLNQGRFTVVTRESDGKKFITRMNLENYGVTNTAGSMRQAMQALAADEIPTVNQPVVRAKDFAAEARSKDPLEFTASDGKKIQVERNAQQAAAMKALRERKIPVQELDTFRNKVQNLVTTSN